MKTKEMERIINESFNGTIDVDEERGINGEEDFIAIFINKTDDLIDGNAMFKGFWTGHGKTKTKAIRNLYTTLMAVTWNTIRQMAHEE